VTQERAIGHNPQLDESSPQTPIRT